MKNIEIKQEETTEKEIFLIRHKKIILFVYFSILLFTVYKVVNIEYKNFKIDAEKINTNYILDNLTENRKVEDEAIKYFINKDYSKALPIFAKLSNQNMVISTYYLGLMYEKGYGVNIDINKAVVLYKKSTLEGLYTPLVRLRNLILKDSNVLNDGTALSKALKNVALVPNEKNIKELLKFYDLKNIPTISSDFYYEFGKKSFISLINNPDIFDNVIKDVEKFDNGVKHQLESNESIMAS